MADWSCIYRVGADGEVGLFALTGELPSGALRVTDFVGGVPRYVHPELIGTYSTELPDTHLQERINKVVAAVLPSYSQPSSDSDETKAGGAERP